MKSLDTIARVRREHFIRHRSIREISRELNVSRNTVRKILRSGATEFQYEREVQPLPTIGPWREQLDRLLMANEGKATRERLTLIRLFEELREAGFKGSYDAVRRYAKAWGKERGSVTADAYVPLSFAAGEAYQFDWSHEVVRMNNATVVLKVAHVRLCPRIKSGVGSAGCFLRVLIHAKPRRWCLMLMQTSLRSLRKLDCKAFAFFRGTCTRGIYDNMKTAVDAIFVGKDRMYNRRFLQMCSHYLIEPTACTPASSWEKGQVENQVGLVRERFFTPILRVKSLEELNSLLLDKSIAYAKAHKHPEITDQTIWQMFEAERPHLVPSSGCFNGFHASTAAVSKTCLVRFDNVRYSVTSRAVGRPVEVQAYADRIIIRQDGAIVAEHARSFTRGETVYDPWHYLPVLARKPGATVKSELAQWCAVQELGSAFRIGTCAT
jgi:transposase